MDFKELLTKQGLEEESINKILAAMKENNIHTATQENLDIRYEKLKSKHDDLETQIKSANDTIADLKKANKDNQKLQTALDDYKKNYETLEAESNKKIRDITINSNVKALMKEHKAKEKYQELLMTKIDKDTLEIDEDGNVKGLDDVFGTLKTEYEDLFVKEPPQLGGNEPDNKGGSADGESAEAEAIKNAIFGY